MLVSGQRSSVLLALTMPLSVQVLLIFLTTRSTHSVSAEDEVVHGAFALEPAYG